MNNLTTKKYVPHFARILQTALSCCWHMKYLIGTEEILKNKQAIRKSLTCWSLSSFQECIQRGSADKF